MDLIDQWKAAMDHEDELLKGLRNATTKAELDERAAAWELAYAEVKRLAAEMKTPTGDR